MPRFMVAVGLVVALGYFLLGTSADRPGPVGSFGEPWTLDELVLALNDDGLETQIVVDPVLSHLYVADGPPSLPPLPGPLVYAQVALNGRGANVYLYDSVRSRSESWQETDRGVSGPWNVSDQVYFVVDNVVIHTSAFSATDGASTPRLRNALRAVQR